MPPDAMPIDDAALRRMRWRARRGLLENDLILGRFFERHANTLQPADWLAVQALLELDDNHLLDLLLGHAEPTPEQLAPAQLQVLHWLRAA
ncbi:MAG: succinate dehydrogenase assembly factor 2 [Betaproteobacteria bacterium]|nr:succinate dehydrogenase assembly factor 2 [Betaproteobacteria bacterium]MDE2123286.1 succinate dehydrogenase assembly factor 2 [Betaproteobacteria bacterium]MDE2187956.1 succinate dehydrogenase assembly factor 2 [Betaproteobacteria bacterium]MDE2325737.1 succinate dehydrogenase assembly factor 2 [Betaproteobacteria bacterium]